MRAAQPSNLFEEKCMKKEIIAYFKKNPHANVKSKQLASMMGLFDDYEIAEMKAQLHTLVKEEVLAKLGKRYSLQIQNDSARVTGRLEITRQGFGFVIPTNKKLPDVFIASRNLNTAMHGDIVEVSMFAKQKKGAKNLDGEIISIVKRKWTSVSGILKRSKSAYYVIPDISEIQNDIYIDPNSVGTAKEGDKVLVSEIEWDSPNRAPEGKITKIFTDKHSPETEYISIMTEYNLPSSFPETVLQEVRQLDLTISEEELKSRVDMREEVVLTIDPFDAKDFDDALSIKTLSNGNLGLLANMAKNAGLPWDLILSAEVFRHYKPDPETYLGVAEIFDLQPSEVMLVAAHEDDLDAAKACGLQTAFVERPLEYGVGAAAAKGDLTRFTYASSDLNDLARQMGV